MMTTGDKPRFRASVLDPNDTQESYHVFINVDKDDDRGKLINAIAAGFRRFHTDQSAACAARAEFLRLANTVPPEVGGKPPFRTYGFAVVWDQRRGRAVGGVAPIFGRPNGDDGEEIPF